MKSSKKGIILAIVLIAITIIATGSFITVKAYGSITVKKNMELGNKYLQEGKYDEAMLAFEKVISINAKNEQASNRLGLIKNYKQIEKLYAAEDYKPALELISKTKAVEGFNFIETVVDDINKNAESKLQIMKEIDNLSNVVEKLIGEKKFAEATSLVNKYSDKDLNDEYKQKLEDLLFNINKAKSDYEEHQKKLAEEKKRKEEEKEKAEKAAREKAAREAAKRITPSKAENIVRSVVLNNSKSKMRSEFDHEENIGGTKYFVIHIYEVVVDHTATMGWYYVDAKSGKVFDGTFGDLQPMN